MHRSWICNALFYYIVNLPENRFSISISSSIGFTLYFGIRSLAMQPDFSNGVGAISWYKSIGQILYKSLELTKTRDLTSWSSVRGLVAVVSLITVVVVESWACSSLCCPRFESGSPWSCVIIGLLEDDVGDIRFISSKLDIHWNRETDILAN